MDTVTKHFNIIETSLRYHFQYHCMTLAIEHPEVFMLLPKCYLRGHVLRQYRYSEDGG